MPVEEMVQMCRKRNVLSFIDGAHALGSLEFNISAIDPDFYVSNAHKWLSCPKGAAFLYVKKSWQEMIRPAVISHGLGSGFSSEFIWSGLHDYSPMLSLHTVLDFWLAVGPQNIRTYMHKMAQEGASVLTKSWETRLAAPAEMFGSMVLVELPASIHSMFQTLDYSAAESIQNSLYHDYNIEQKDKMFLIASDVRVAVAHLVHQTYIPEETLSILIDAQCLCLKICSHRKTNRQDLPLPNQVSIISMCKQEEVTDVWTNPGEYSRFVNWNGPQDC
ncbi:L-cysteine desulfhydrase [Aplysia californica]|uniref:L-cysteine desulfhydrase n=1 Tax=Aplysia californica TaxID=6500 RepID=A0ABM1VW08_APLCA|nr:L-cysteine desulfhydrase [Aplysia californica]